MKYILAFVSVLLWRLKSNLGLGLKFNPEEKWDPVEYVSLDG